MARSNVLTVALAISTLFHLSMVSVVSIVIRFPSPGIHYLPLEIVERPVARTLRHGIRDELRAPSPDNLLEKARTAALEPGTESQAWDALPPVELTRLRLTVADPLRTPAQSLQIRSQFSDLFEPRPPDMPDSWAVFTHQLREIGPTLSRWTISGKPKEEKPLQQVSTSIPGIGVYIEWMSEPKQRKALLAPPMQALLNIDPGLLTEPIAIVFTVNARGKVTEVHSPAVGDNAAAIEGIRDVLMKYVFEPLETEQVQNQRGTLLIKPESSEP
jgi:hypothetical protein